VTTRRRGWRWTNFPVPEAYLIVGGVGVILGLIWPLTFGWDGPWPLVVGLVLVVVGVGTMIWATGAAGRVLLADPDQLVTTGPYAISRHPMYLGWTFVYLGLTVLLDSVWLLILLPILAVWINREAMREERRMLERFGDDYVRYQKAVRRYL
jgi:protein-S-isoprenylcysteine O-methyltransferase Ste14